MAITIKGASKTLSRASSSPRKDKFVVGANVNLKTIINIERFPTEDHQLLKLSPSDQDESCWYNYISFQPFVSLAHHFRTFHSTPFLPVPST